MPPSGRCPHRPLPPLREFQSDRVTKLQREPAARQIPKPQEPELRRSACRTSALVPQSGIGTRRRAQPRVAALLWADRLVPRDREPVLQNRLAGAEARAIGAEGARAHASRQAGGRERRGHIAQGSAAVAALGKVIFGDAEPVTASVTFRIDALNSPARQILHGLPPAFSRGTASERARTKARNSGSDRKSWADNGPQFGGCQGEMPQDVVADWKRRKVAECQSYRVTERALEPIESTEKDCAPLAALPSISLRASGASPSRGSGQALRVALGKQEDKKDGAERKETTMSGRGKPRHESPCFGIGSGRRAKIQRGDNHECISQRGRRRARD
jgi:hypothetical protein